MMSLDAHTEPLTKRPKYSADQPCSRSKIAPAWKVYATESLGPEGKVFGLQDIFFARDLVETENNTNSPNQFYTFRMEHRQGGPMSKFPGEERILLFRSDKNGAIAKIIYSSEAPDEDEHDTVIPSMEGQNLPSLIAHAKIHVLDVKAQYRGRDLGGLLFSEAITSLKSLYCNQDDDDDTGADGDPANIQKKKIYDVECSLDAEEDITRHGKLVKFYE